MKGTNSDSPDISEFTLLFENLESKMIKKFEFIDQRENQFLAGYSRVRIEVDKLNESVENIIKQENYLIQKQQKYKEFINLLKENSNEKIEKLRVYCNDTFAK